MKRPLILLSIIVALIILLRFFRSRSADFSKDEAEIRSLELSTWNRPGRHLTVGPIVVVESHAIADWTQGEMGGRALLHKRAGRWAISLCSGDRLKQPEVLADFGISKPIAILLAERLAEAEKTTDPQRVARFSSFNGVAMMNGAASPTPDAAGMQVRK